MAKGNGPREEQIAAWKELGMEGRLELGCSLISLGWELEAQRGSEPVDRRAA